MEDKNLFDHIDAIYQNQKTKYFDELNESEKKAYNQYMVNRFISMNPYQAVIVNEIQKYSKIPSRAHYQFYSNMLPKKKQYNKYIKKSKKKEYPEWLINLLTEYYKVSVREVVDYISIFCSSKENMDELKQICNLYAIDKKEMKQLDKLGEF